MKPTARQAKPTARQARPAPEPSRPTTAKSGRDPSRPTTAKRRTDAGSKGGAPALVEPRVARATFEALAAHHADAHCELVHTNAFELLVATVLSAQSTDVMVNRITPDVFARWPSPAALAAAAPAEVEQTLNRIGMFRQKTKNIVALSKQLVERHGGEVPRSLAELVQLPGVGRKTANVVLGVAFNTPEGVVVDTHVQRLAQRLGWTAHAEPVEIEQDLMRTFAREQWDPLSHVLIFHGRRICTARKPACAACPVNRSCPSAFNAEAVGRKGPRPARFLGKLVKAAGKAAKAVKAAGAGAAAKQLARLAKPGPSKRRRTPG